MPTIYGTSGYDYIIPSGSSPYTSYTVYTYEGNDGVYTDSGDDTLYGQDGDDFLSAHRGDDNIFGGDGDDTLLVTDGNNKISGGNGNDYISGGNDSDTLKGNDGNDTIIGGNGEDTIVGGKGDDILAGESMDDLGPDSTDIFSFVPNSWSIYGPDQNLGSDTIVDFSLGDDLIQLTGSADIDDLSFESFDGNAGDPTADLELSYDLGSKGVGDITLTGLDYDDALNMAYDAIMGTEAYTGVDWVV